jgi:hypothetical protein
MGFVLLELTGMELTPSALRHTMLQSGTIIIVAVYHPMLVGA